MTRAGWAMDRSDPRDALSRLILGGDPTLTSQEVADRVGVDVADARRLWRALGFADSKDARAFVDADLEALRLVQNTVASGALDQETILRLTRALGSTMSRLADWQVATLAERLEDQTGDVDGETENRLATAMGLGRSVGPAFEHLLVYAWRRHLAAAVARVETQGLAEEDVLHADLTVGFADLVSFTALSNGLDDDSLGELVEKFESRCSDVVTQGGGRTIKTLGDAVLFVADPPESGVEIALRVIEEIGTDDRLPDVRVGLGTGSVIMRLGDVYGPPVNLAARLTAVARRNRAIIDRDTADRLSDAYETRALPPRPLRGFGNVEPVTVRRRWRYTG